MTSNEHRRWYQFSLRSRLIAAVVVGLLLAGRIIYQNVVTGVARPDKVTLYSLEFHEEWSWNGIPEADENEKFHDIPVLGKVEITDPEKQREIIAALNMAKAQGTNVAKCFYPRHGVRVVENGREVDHLICFECHWLRIYLNGFLRSDAVPISSWAQPVVNKHLKEANVPISPDALGEEEAR